MQPEILPEQYPLGHVSSQVEHLLAATEEALMNGIKQALAGNHIGDISRAVEQTAIKAKLGVVRDYVGHGCGIKLHEPPGSAKLPEPVQRAAAGTWNGTGD